MKKLFLFFVLSLFFIKTRAQKDTTSYKYKPMIIKFDESGANYLRIMFWSQIWLSMNEKDPKQDAPTFTLKRSRVLLYGQLGPKFFLITHFGLNNLTDDNLTISGLQGQGPTLFLHDAYAQWNVDPEKISIGMGLHYWNGVSRLTNTSTINMLTLDAPSPYFGWANLGYSGQFARHFGLFAKGTVLKKLAYRASFNTALTNTFDTSKQINEQAAIYSTKFAYSQVGVKRGSAVIQGYADWQFFDKESSLLPYMAGTYLGKKKVLNLGGGFLFHSNGSIILKPGETPLNVNYDEDELRQKTNTIDVTNFAVDVFYDSPIGRGAITAYSTMQWFEYGKNFVGRWASTGNVFYTHVGYLIPKFCKSGRMQPYIGFTNYDYEAFDNKGNQYNIGVNWYVHNHNVKFTLEHISTQDAFSGLRPERNNEIRLQFQLLL